LAGKKRVGRSGECSPAIKGDANGVSIFDHKGKKRGKERTPSGGKDAAQKKGVVFHGILNYQFEEKTRGKGKGEGTGMVPKRKGGEAPVKEREAKPARA